MLPNSHFEKIEKGAIDQINPSAKPITKDANVAPKKVVEIKENALDKNVKASDDDDDSEYDYYNEYDDDIDGDDTLVTVTPKIVAANKMRMYKVPQILRECKNFNAVLVMFLFFNRTPPPAAAASKVNKPTTTSTSAPMTVSKVKSNPKLKLISDADDLDEDEGVTDGASDEGKKKLLAIRWQCKNDSISKF